MQDTPSNNIDSISPQILSYTIQGFNQATGIGHTSLYADIKSGKLKTRMIGGGKRKKYLILREDGIEYLKSFPAVKHQI